MAAFIDFYGLDEMQADMLVGSIGIADVAVLEDRVRKAKSDGKPK